MGMKDLSKCQLLYVRFEQFILWCFQTIDNQRINKLILNNHTWTIDTLNMNNWYPNNLSSNFDHLYNFLSNFEHLSNFYLILNICTIYHLILKNWFSDNWPCPTMLIKNVGGEKILKSKLTFENLIFKRFLWIHNSQNKSFQSQITFSNILLRLQSDFFEKKTIFILKLNLSFAIKSKLKWKTINFLSC